MKNLPAIVDEATGSTESIDKATYNEKPKCEAGVAVASVEAVTNNVPTPISGSGGGEQRDLAVDPSRRLQ